MLGQYTYIVQQACEGKAGTDAFIFTLHFPVNSQIHLRQLQQTW